ncbi:MAG: CoA-binding protein [Aureliella sp.]|jgi:predicted CoA-binding protein
MYEQEIQRFLSAEHFAVAGASHDRSKYGNKVLRALLQHDKNVVAIHPMASDVEGTPTFKSINDVPHAIESLSIITPPQVTEKIVAEAVERGVRAIWMQPGAESEAAIELARSRGIDVIAGGPCLLVSIRYHE